MYVCTHWCMNALYIHVQFNARCVCKGMNTLDMLTCRDVSMYACMNEKMHACAHVHIKASKIACLHLWKYGVYSHKCAQAHNDIMCACLHLSNYDCVCVHACIRIYTYSYIYIYAHVHSCMCACTHVCMDTCISVENMMRTQTLIGYVGNDLTMHGLLERMHNYTILTIIADTIIATLYMQKLTIIYI